MRITPMRTEDEDGHADYLPDLADSDAFDDMTIMTACGCGEDSSATFALIDAFSLLAL